MIETFIQYPLLLLFTVAALGYFFGSISVRGNSLGVAAILFIGLIFGSLDARLQIPEIILFLGLSIYVYSVGLSSGLAFFKSYKKNGFRDFGFIIFILSLSGGITILLWWLMGFSAATIAGTYAGSTTNTAALAGLIDYFGKTFNNDIHTVQLFSEEAVVGFSFSYPMGVLGGIISIVVMEKWLGIDYEKEEIQLRKIYPLNQKLHSVSVEVTKSDLAGMTLRAIFKLRDWDLSFGRIHQGTTVHLIHWDTIFEIGDFITMVGTEEELSEFITKIGQRAEVNYAEDQSIFNTNRIFVSNPDLAGRTIASLNLREKYNAVITRLRRGDIDMIAKADMRLKIGDRIRFVAAKEDLEDLSLFFGDSYQSASKVNLFSFGLGIGIGLLLGSFEFNLGNGITFQLGYAGGVLIIGLILGALKRTGNIVWELPYSANVTLQQIGLIFLLSAIGVRSGNSFVNSFTIEGLWLFGTSAVISLGTAFSILFFGYKVLKIPFSFLLGMVANQPAILEFATSRTKNKIPMYGYAMMFPIALILKIIITQILFIILQ